LFRLKKISSLFLTSTLALTLASTLTSCQKGKSFDCFKSNGKLVTETRHTEAFDEININDVIEVTIHSGPEYVVEVSAGEHIVKKITSQISNRVLDLENIATCNFVRGYKKTIKVSITTPRLVKISNHSVGKVVFASDFHQDSLFVRAENSGDIYINGDFKLLRTSSHGNGDVYLSGSAQDLLIYTYGTNFIQAENFRVRGYLFIATKTIGDVHFNLDGLGIFQYTILDAGNIYYKGNPAIIENVGDRDSKGQLIKIE
jgi:hypothetical protein